jgi:glutamyl endopeptidase
LPGYNPGGDSAEASRGDRNATVIIGFDGRTRVTPTTAYPNSAMVYLVTNQGTCSGFMVSQNLVATAGHCVYKESAGGWVTNVTAYVGRDGGSSIGTCTDIQVYTTDKWMDSKETGHDYGAVELNCTIGNTSGWLGLRVVANPVNQKAILSGYPSNKTLGTQWRGNGNVLTAQTRTIRYNTDTSGGQDGGPVWNNVNGTCGPCAIGIHTNNKASTTYNQGIRVTQNVLDLYAEWDDFIP